MIYEELLYILSLVKHNNSSNSNSNTQDNQNTNHYTFDTYGQTYQHEQRNRNPTDNYYKNALPNEDIQKLTGFFKVLKTSHEDINRSFAKGSSNIFDSEIVNKRYNLLVSAVSDILAILESKETKDILGICLMSYFDSIFEKRLMGMLMDVLENGNDAKKFCKVFYRELMLLTYNNSFDNKIPIATFTKFLLSELNHHALQKNKSKKKIAVIKKMIKYIFNRNLLKTPKSFNYTHLISRKNLWKYKIGECSDDLFEIVCLHLMEDLKKAIIFCIKITPFSGNMNSISKRKLLALLGLASKIGFDCKKICEKYRVYSGDIGLTEEEKKKFNIFYINSDSDSDSDSPVMPTSNTWNTLPNNSDNTEKLYPTQIEFDALSRGDVDYFKDWVRKNLVNMDILHFCVRLICLGESRFAEYMKLKYKPQKYEVVPSINKSLQAKQVKILEILLTRNKNQKNTVDELLTVDLDEIMMDPDNSNVQYTLLGLLNKKGKPNCNLQKTVRKLIDSGSYKFFYNIELELSQISKYLLPHGLKQKIKTTKLNKLKEKYSDRLRLPNMDPFNITSFKVVSIVKQSLQSFQTGLQYCWQKKAKNSTSPVKNNS
ncbi:hypothetical protein ACFLZV_07320 [Candidatus Margulisiibacteriota bacterium]